MNKTTRGVLKLDRIDQAVIIVARLRIGLNYALFVDKAGRICITEIAKFFQLPDKLFDFCRKYFLVT